MRGKKVSEGLSYKRAGVDIDVADATKREMAKCLETSDARVLNKVGAFASLYDGVFPGYQHPVLVLKMEEPGSKQKIALEHGCRRSICFDMINHLINDIAVMGAKPLAVQDAIICGKLDKEVVQELVSSMSEACRAQGAVLVGGETSEQPGVLAAGTYVLTASVVGVVEQSRVIDGSAVTEGDAVIGVASNGLHTNGYSLVRALMEQNPRIMSEKIGGETFLQVILRPHLCYFQALKELFGCAELHALAHITGGGIEGNLCRVIPAGLSARITKKAVRTPAIFEFIRKTGHVEEDEMYRTFNMGVGLVAVCARGETDRICSHFSKCGYDAYPIGAIAAGKARVEYGDYS